MRLPASHTHIYWLALGPIGDALMTVSALREALERDASLRVTVLARRNADLIRNLAERYPIRVMDVSSLPQLAVAILRMAGKKSVLILPTTFGRHSRLIQAVETLVRILPKVISVGYADKRGKASYDMGLTYDFQRTFIDNQRRLLNAVHIPTAELGSTPSLELDGVPVRESLQHLNAYLVIHPFAANPSRSLPPERWKALFTKLKEAYPEYELVISGSEADAAQAHAWFDGLEVLYALGNELRERITLLKGAALYIGVDTGITHLASVMGVPAILIGNRSNPTWLPTYAPSTTTLVEARNCTCDGRKGGDCFVIEQGQKYYRCLYEITDRQVLDAIDRTLQSVPGDQSTSTR